MASLSLGRAAGHQPWQDQGSDVSVQAPPGIRMARGCRQEALAGKKDLDAAVDDAVSELPDDFVIRDFIMANRAEVKTMLLTEYNEEKVLEKERLEGRREGREEGRKKERKDLTDLMNYLFSHGRGSDAQRAFEDESFLDQLLLDFRSGLMTAK